MAWLPPSRHAVHRGLRIPDLREGDDFPLKTSFHRALPATCRSRRLSTQRIRHCGLSVTFQIRSQPCAGGWPMRSSGPCNDVRVAGAGRKTSIVVYAYDAVRLGRRVNRRRHRCATTLPQGARRSHIRVMMLDRYRVQRRDDGKTHSLVQHQMPGL